jgi:hypothetical protein
MMPVRESFEYFGANPENPRKISDFIAFKK